ncbi:unnamed protein product [Schistosoma curassoni]|uniref:Secreted protein n=1 Tax=Schistosoma curassoni TaxID=6186 RepID=A0A183JI06_9TREM|nr:unnamed protein product [Schistosoma curassoni]
MCGEMRTLRSYLTFVLMMLFRRTMKAPRPNHPAKRTKLRQNHPHELQIISAILRNNPECRTSTLTRYQDLP